MKTDDEINEVRREAQRRLEIKNGQRRAHEKRSGIGNVFENHPIVPGLLSVFAQIDRMRGQP